MKRRLFFLAKALAGVVIAVCIFGALRANWISLRDTADKLKFHWVWVAALIAVFYRVFNAAGWGMVLRALGHPLPTWTGVRLWLVAETMRWLPGSVWGFASRVYQAQKNGVPAAIASLSMPLELAITVVAWTFAALAGGAGLSRIVGDWAAHFPKVPWAAFTVGLVLLPVCGAALIWRFPEIKISRKARGFLRGLALAFAARPQPLMLLATLGWFTALSFLNGLAFYAVLYAFAPPVMPPVNVIIGINAIGWLVGFFAVFSPGGLGVREGGMTALLLPLMPPPVAVGSVILWRAIQIVVELVCLSICYLVSAAWAEKPSVPFQPVRPSSAGEAV